MSEPDREPEASGPILETHRMALLGRVAPGIAHELGNRLSAIVAFGHLLRGDPAVPERVRDDAELVIAEAERARTAVQALLGLARPRRADREPTSLAGLLEGLRPLVEYELRAARATLEVDVADGLPPLELDRAGMRQALLGILVDVVAAAGRRDEPSTIRVSVRAAERQGARHIRMELAGPTEAGDERSGAEPGGAVAPLVIQAHGGLLSRVEGGVVIELPLDPVDDPRAADPVDRRAAFPAPPPVSTTPVADVPDADLPRVLVLDDEPAIRAFLAKALRLAGFQAIVASNGREALDAVRRERLVAVLCDHRMVDMNGIDVYRAIAVERPELAGRFAFMSGDVGNPVLEEFTIENGIPLLAKPFDIETVARTVRGLVGADAPAR